MINLTDEQLVQSCLQGAEQALDVLFVRYLKPLYNFIYRLVGDKKEAEDLTQETLVKIWKNLTKFKQNKKFKTWVYQIARNTAIDYLRKKRPISFSALDNNIDDEDAGFSATLKDKRMDSLQILQKQDVERELQNALNLIPPAYRLVLVMHYLEQLSFLEISEILNEPLNTVKSRSRRGLVMLKRHLAKP